MLASYTAYFDSSEGGRSASPTADPIAGTYVGGFVSSVESWGKFEIDWRLALAGYDIPYFHMKDFVAKQRQFSDPKWKSEKYRATLIATLIEVMNSHTMHSFCQGLWHPYYESLNERFQLESRFNPYAICGLGCALEARAYVRQRCSGSLPIEFVFEQGDVGANLLRREMPAAGLPVPIFRPDRVLERNPEWRPAVPLQACDLVAWEFHRETNRQHILTKVYPFRKSLHALRRIPNTWKNHTLDTLEQFCIDRGIPPKEEK